MSIEITANIEEKLSKVPEAPGVYMMRDAAGEVIYVGKAKSLRSRVRSYFRRTGDTRAYYELLTRRIADFEFVVTGNEKEALILENNLIKQFQPRYNIRLRDEKTYISLRIDLNEPFPRIQFPKRAESRAEVDRRKGKPGVIYFGPYASGKAARETVRFVNSIFPIRKCKAVKAGVAMRPCLYGQIGLCMSPCSGETDEAGYREMLKDAILFLQGKDEEVTAALRGKMKAAAAAKDFEGAAVLRDRIRSIEQTVEKQKITGEGQVVRDVFGLYREGDAVAFQAMFVREGRLEDVATYEFESNGRPDAELLSEFLQQFYGQLRFMPPEVLVPVEPTDAAALREWLADVRGGSVTLSVPQRGVRRELVEMASRNARSSFEARHTDKQRAAALMGSLQGMLGLRKAPCHIECFDISNFGGRLAVGSLAAFVEGVADKSRYRHFKIRTVEGQDDFAMLREVLGRRYREREDLPDMILVDGGAGQVSAVMDVLRGLGIEGEVDLVGIAKAHRRTEREQLFKPGAAEPIVPPRDSGELLFLQRVRDEAHRFAITYHRKLRERKFLQSPLEGVAGLGPMRIAALRKKFGTYQAMEAATAEQLAETEGISPRLARVIYHHLHERVEP